MQQQIPLSWFSLYYAATVQDTSFLRSYFCDELFRRVWAVNIVWRPCSDSSHVTAPYKLSFYY